MISTQYIKLNMTPSGVLPVLYCSQYDIGRPLGLVVYNDSAPVDLDTYTVTIEATRTDGTPITAAVTTDDNIGVFVTTAEMTNKKDKYLAKLVLIDNSTNRVASLAFAMVITPATMDENAQPIQEDRSLYQQYTGTVQSLIADIREDIADLNSQTHDTVVDMKADTNLKAGMYVRTGGYYAVNDGGGVLYRIYATIPATYYETLANGLYAEPMLEECVTPKMFGAKGDGTSDDSNAFANAIAWVNEHNTSTQVGTHSVTVTPVLVIPAGKYLINNVRLNAQGIHIVGTGGEIHTDDTAFIASGSNCRKLILECVTFVGGAVHLNLSLNNLEATQVTIRDCYFYGAATCSIRYTSRSSNLNVDGCHFYKNTQICDIESGDGVRFSKCWFNDATRETNYGAAIISKGDSLHFNECFFIPSGTVSAAVEPAWVNQYGLNLTFNQCRISNETGVITLVNNYSKVANLQTIANGISIINCDHLNTSVNIPVIRLFDIPYGITISSDVIAPLDYVLIEFSQSVNPSNLVDALWNLNSGNNILLECIKIDIRNLKTRMNGIRVNTFLLPFIKSDNPIYTYPDAVSASFNIPLKKMRTADGLDGFFGSIIKITGVIDINTSGTRQLPFDGIIYFNRQGNTIETYCKLFTENVSASVSASISVGSSLIDATITVTLESLISSFPIYKVRKYSYEWA